LLCFALSLSATDVAALVCVHHTTQGLYRGCWANLLSEQELLFI
jgi:hypothetical protein